MKLTPSFALLMTINRVYSQLERNKINRDTAPKWYNKIKSIASSEDDTLVCKKNAPCAKKTHPCAKKMHPPRFGVFKKVLNNKNNLLVKVKFMKK